MKVYCQFKTLSTGYVQGSCPPQFKDDLKKPIDLLGSDGVYILDGRNNLNTMINDCHNRLNKLINENHIVGFEIIRAERFTDNGKIIYSNI